MTLTSTSLDSISKDSIPDLAKLEIRTFKNGFGAILGTFYLPILLFRIAKFTKRNRVKKAFFLMPHIWDLPLLLLFKSLRIDNSIVVHDPKPHSGELFPSKYLMSLETKIADKVYFLSDYASKQISINPKKFVISYLPIPKPIMPPPEKIYQILFVGRIKKYKGLDILIEAMRLSEANALTLTIVSFFKGELPKVPKNVRVINSWLDEKQFEKAIASAELVVLPYRDATQSGIIPIAIANKVPCVVTPVGGLPEMVKNFSCGLVTESLEPNDILRTMLNCLAKPNFSFAKSTQIDPLTKAFLNKSCFDGEEEL
jgi:glycosyltransferase involved in cell wall biosynthesis